MKLQKEVALILAISASVSGFAAGFALYEGSARGNALGGAVMGKAVDASANFYNPATLTDMTGTVITVGMTTEHPTADTYVDGRSSVKMDPGCFVLPHIYLAQELPWGFALGLGFAPEYGLGSDYGTWPLMNDTRKTTIEGLVFNPNLAYRVTDDWSVSAGFRMMYFTFEQYSRPDVGPIPNLLPYTVPYALDNRLKGDNGMLDWGWQLSTKYDITDKLSAGVMYKSYIDTKVKGRNTARARIPGMEPVAAAATGSASAELRLPQSVTAGLNYDATDDLHLGTSVTWTQWSSIETLVFRIPSGPNPHELKWNDVWRLGVGGAYDITDDLTFMISYVYDMDPSHDDRGTTMLPPGDRHIGTVGLGYKWGPVDISVSYGLVFMCSESRQIDGHVFDTENGLSHAVGVTMSYQF